MSDREAFELLNGEGDLLERFICKSANEFGSVIYSYAEIWKKFVYRFRLPGNTSIVEDHRLPFAGSHYTALVRLHHSYKSKCELEKLQGRVCDAGNDPDILLDCHRTVAAFYENLGSCIDNLCNSFKDAKLIDKDSDDESEDSRNSNFVTKKFPDLGEAYLRRNQHIHSRLIPQFFDEGVLQFDRAFLEDKDIEWKIERNSQIAFLEDHLNEVWEKYIAELGNVWALLNCRLNESEFGQKVPKNEYVADFQHRESPSLTPSDFVVFAMISGVKPNSE